MARLGFSLWLRATCCAVFFALSGCANQATQEAPPAAEASPIGDYKIGVGDSLQVNVWRNPELSMAVVVRPDGKISLPLVGDVAAAGQTSTVLATQLATALNNFVRSPQVTVIVTNPVSTDFQRRVRVTGAVHSPQSLPYREGMTVLDLVLLAGGTSDFASGNNAKLYRKVNGQTKVFTILLEDLLEDGRLETNYLLQPSDIVTVPERAF
ncbi:MAG TPA: polysaccharide export protein [Cellvibrionaceae bacterium]|nr:polysaccharide export protein [Cellvibrionaceae bacterium]